MRASNSDADMACTGVGVQQEADTSTEALTAMTAEIAQLATVRVALSDIQTGHLPLSRQLQGQGA